MDSKDAQESLESGGGGARCRCSNGRRSAAAVFVIQSLLTAACAAFSLNVFLNQQHHQQQPESTKDRGIFMQMRGTELGELKFMALWNHSVDLNNEKTVKLSCAGPYIVYLWACVNSYNTDTVVNLTLEQGNQSFHLQTLQKKECKEMQGVFMLSNRNEVTLKVSHIKDTFKIEDLFLGLHYMLGAQCFHHPLLDEK